MNKRQDHMEKMLALLLPGYAIGLLVGESLRDALYGQPVAHPPDASTSQPKKWRRYSGLFVLLKQKWHVSPPRWRDILNTALAAFLAIVHPPVPT